MKNFIALSVLVVTQVLGNVWLSRGIRQVGELNTLNPSSVFAFGVHALTNPWVVLGILFLIAALLLYLAVLSWLELSYVMPMTASGYVLNALFAWLILGENISQIKWAGTLIVTVGVLVVGLSEGKTKPTRTKKQKSRNNIYFSLLPLAFGASRQWLLVLLVVLVDSAGNIFFTKGMKQVGEVTTLQLPELLRLAKRAVNNSMLGLGMVCMTIGFFLFIVLLSWADLSFIMPATALGYPVSILGTRYILKENVTAARFAGAVFVCIGVALISLNPSGQ